MDAQTAELVRSMHEMGLGLLLSLCAPLVLAVMIELDRSLEARRRMKQHEGRARLAALKR